MPSSVTDEDPLLVCKFIPVIHFRRHSKEAPEAGSARDFQNLRVTIMTKNERRRAALPYQDVRILSSHARFSSPRHNSTSQKNRRDGTLLRRIRHGNARAIENLRGMRLSLVPGPDSRDCLLQGV